MNTSFRSPTTRPPPVINPAYLDLEIYCKPPSLKNYRNQQMFIQNEKINLIFILTLLFIIEIIFTHSITGCRWARWAGHSPGRCWATPPPPRGRTSTAPPTTTYNSGCRAVAVPSYSSPPDSGSRWWDMSMIRMTVFMIILMAVNMIPIITVMMIIFMIVIMITIMTVIVITSWLSLWSPSWLSWWSLSWLL